MGQNPVKLDIKTEMGLNPEQKRLKFSNMGHDPIKLDTSTEMDLNPEQKRLKTFKHGPQPSKTCYLNRNGPQPIATKVKNFNMDHNSINLIIAQKRASTKRKKE